jgi:hypothetical protein
MTGTRVSALERLTVSVPEGEMDGVRVERFTVERNNLENLRNALRYGRGTAPGTYTRLMIGDQTWMSDTDAERRDHVCAVWKIAEPTTRRVLINGLGLGMVLAAALSFDHVEHVDVVEIDERVIQLVGSHYSADPRVVIHHADAYEQTRRWPRGTCWDVGWSDIWGDISTDDLPSMGRLNRSYARRCDWHECWCFDLLKRMQAQERAEERRYADFMS